MKNKILKISVLVIILIVSVFALSGCNHTIIDRNYTFDRAIVILNDGTRIEIEIKEWSDYDGEQIQIKGKDGKIYLVSSFNTILIKDE